ncbi:MAG: 3-ketoacyl-ACP reductase [Chloroflexi bacterium RBG_16_72_14]|nr:MAG: 3-ketoacyl-ACP reductase [Chloroflexi bacterium RBG_16_72_14]
MRLQDRIIGITGAGSGIGRACALAYAAEGAVVAATDLSDRADAVVRLIADRGGRARAWSLDVTDRAAIPGVIDAIRTVMGGLDVWHNNAGVSTMGRFVELTERDWDVNMDINAKGVFNCSQVVARHMIAAGGGKIINTASMAGKKGDVAFLPHYVASKFAVVGLTQAMAAELAPSGITVNAICPGYVVTPMQDNEAGWEAELRGMTPDEVRRLYVDDTPLGRLETAEDVAKVAVFLASSDSDFITGASIDVNGGAWMG